MDAIVFFERQPARRVIGYTSKGIAILQTTEPWRCQWEYNGQHRRLDVPDGYVWDGASIPRIADTIIGLCPSGIMDAPSLAHDTIYRAKGGSKPQAWAGCKLTNQNGNEVIIGRDEADAVLIGTMKHAFIIDGKYSRNERRKCAIVRGIVRLIGGKHWGGPMPAIK